MLCIERERYTYRRGSGENIALALQIVHLVHEKDAEMGSYVVPNDSHFHIPYDAQTVV